MIRTALMLIVSALLLVPAGLAADSDKTADLKFEPLFNGKDLTGWKAGIPESWKFVDGVLVATSDPGKKGDTLKTEKSYHDFVLEADVRFPDDIDSGFIFRKPDTQVQLGVSRSLKKDMTCSVYYKGKYPGQAKGVDKLLKLNDWNAVRIEARGRTIKTWLNGEQVLTWETPDETKPAPIALQIHGGVDMKVEFKNVRIAEIGKE